MMTDLKKQLSALVEASFKQSFPSLSEYPPVDLDKPADRSHGDFSSNVVLKSAKALKKNPYDAARAFCDDLKKHLAESPLKGYVRCVEVKKPGFINFFLAPAAYYGVLEDVLKEKAQYGHSEQGKGQKVQIEFVSANPTGPLSVAHARQAAVGDALGNILSFLGFTVTKEYYVNDEGNQINLLGESVRLRAQEKLSGKPLLPGQMGDDHYKGEYIKDIASAYLDTHRVSSVDALKGQDKSMSLFAVDCLMEVIKTELSDFGVTFDTWSYQSKIATQAALTALVEDFKQKGHIYEKDGALWFKSTAFGDDKDRVVKKSDGSFTYLTPDIVYHQNKYSRGFNRVFNIMGPDHHGYISRLKASVEALGYDPNSLEVLIVQLATIFRDGQPVSMSTRAGQYISLREVLEEVGGDAARFFFLMRHIKAHLEFDLALAKKQTPENPVYYIQYAHARVHSINEKAAQEGVVMKTGQFSRLQEAEELIVLDLVAGFTAALQYCLDQRDPYPLLNYLLELATAFHRFYDRHRVMSEDKELSSERLALANAAGIALANGLKLLGVSTPEKM